jgi:hypothetical protein
MTMEHKNATASYLLRSLPIPAGFVAAICRNTFPLEHAAPLHAGVRSHSLIHHPQARP